MQDCAEGLKADGVTGMPMRLCGRYSLMQPRGSSIVPESPPLPAKAHSCFPRIELHRHRADVAQTKEHEAPCTKASAALCQTS
ncbi:hypothetical protein ILYODFUR_037215 [Ilyodon furcidens]|uniref:Uncharacterized protein n=1 Tax=Ilyodon furcidens TaxID=33524 RepID=A0ABV0TQ12_9TELE